jgi:ubiquinone/menaquinone biosynthesis C-methylase UbiE
MELSFSRRSCTVYSKGEDMDGKPVAAGKSSFDLINTEEMFAIIDLKPHSTFLDLACGVGNYSVEVANRIGEKGTVYAVDLWQEGIAALNQKISVAGIKNIQTRVADITTRLPFEEISVDSCLLATVLHDLSLSGQKSVIEEAVRLLTPGGMLNIVEFKKIEKGPGPPLRIRMDEQDVDSLVTKFGFTKVAGGDVGEFNYLLRYEKSSKKSL